MCVKTRQGGRIRGDIWPNLHSTRQADVRIVELMQGRVGIARRHDMCLISQSIPASLMQYNNLIFCRTNIY